MKRMQAKKHKIRTYEIDKIYLSCLDHKRFVLNDGVHTLAYFHKDCGKNNKNEMRMRMRMSTIDIEGIRTVCYQYYYFFMKKF